MDSELVVLEDQGPSRTPQPRFRILRAEPPLEKTQVLTAFQRKTGARLRRHPETGEFRLTGKWLEPPTIPVFDWDSLQRDTRIMQGSPGDSPARGGIIIREFERSGNARGASFRRRLDGHTWVQVCIVADDLGMLIDLVYQHANIIALREKLDLD